MIRYGVALCFLDVCLWDDSLLDTMGVASPCDIPGGLLNKVVGTGVCVDPLEDIDDGHCGSGLDKGVGNKILLCVSLFITLSCKNHSWLKNLHCANVCVIAPILFFGTFYETSLQSFSYIFPLVLKKIH